jgi:hypothetical protein
VAAALRRLGLRLPELRHVLRSALPATVTVTRVTGKTLLDAHDNLPMSVKGIADSIASAAFGLDDNDPRIAYRFQQEHVDGLKGTHARVVIELLGSAERRLTKPNASAENLNDSNVADSDGQPNRSNDNVTGRCGQ